MEVTSARPRVHAVAGAEGASMEVAPRPLAARICARCMCRFPHARGCTALRGASRMHAESLARRASVHLSRSWVWKRAALSLCGATATITALRNRTIARREREGGCPGSEGERGVGKV